MFDEPERFAPWKRFLLGSTLMIIVAALAASLTAFSQREDVARKIKQNAIKGNISKFLDGSTGGPQTLLLIGSDRRKGDKTSYGARSDTMMLVRLDPSKKTTTVLSIPRDLQVTIPGRGVAKFNETYSDGGPKLVVQTIKQSLGLKVNHVAEVDFGGFAQAVDAIDCVYVDVDRKYFNNNVGAVYGNQFAAINIKAGYQKLCGYRALDYVRFRHFDNDIYRGARQQSFLRQAKQQVGVTELFGSAKKLKKIIANNIRTDDRLASGKNLQRLLTLAVKSSRKPVYQVQFDDLETPTIGGASVVTVSNPALKKAARTFLKGPRQKGDVAPEAGSTAATSAPKRRKAGVPGLPGSMRYSKDEGRKQAGLATIGIKLPVFYPTAMVNGASYQDQGTRGYRMTTARGQRVSAYRIVAKLAGSFGDYYGIQGVNWKDPPILNNPSEIRRIKGRDYELFYEGGKLAMVAFERESASYWVSNTLLRKLTEKQMLALATSLRVGR
ncbi:MAG: LCP family protein [Solirubrobacterales bacterium]|nr:LCP family protein [Solirubrobacterales bacterium]